MFKLVATFFNLSISNLPTSDFKLAKSTIFLAKSDVSTPAVFFKSVFGELGKSNSTFTFALQGFGFGQDSSNYTLIMSNMVISSPYQDN